MRSSTDLQDHLPLPGDLVTIRALRVATNIVLALVVLCLLAGVIMLRFEIFL